MKIQIFIAFLAFVAISSAAFVGRPHHKKNHLLGAKECTYGPTYWCQNLTTAADCHAVPHCIQTVWIHKQLPPDNSNVCQTCLDMVKQARDQLLSNDTQELIKQVFEGSCQLLYIKPIVKECDHICDDYIPELIDTLASQMNPQVVCSVAGLCNSARVDRLIAENEAEKKAMEKIGSRQVEEVTVGDSCKGCHTVVDLLENKFSKMSRDDVLQGFMSFCGKMSSFSDACSNIVVTYFSEIYDHLQENLNSQEVCLMSGECSAQFHTHANVEITPMSHIGYVRPPNDKEDLPCELCEQLVNHLRDLLIANTTVNEFKMVLEGLCKQTKSFKNECLSIVDEYYDMIYNFLVKEMNPKEACLMIGICPNSKSELETPIIPLLPAESSEAEKVVHINLPNDFMGVPPPLPIELLVPPHARQLYNKETCQFCEYFLHFVQQAITSPKTEYEIKDIIDKACARLPRSINSTCVQFVDSYEPAMVAILAQEIDPSQMCPLIRACPSGNGQEVEVFMQQNNEDSPKCPLCLYAVTELENSIKGKKTEESIKTALGQVCTHLPSTMVDECKDFVTTYTDELIEMMIKDLSAEEVCEFLKFCKDPKPAAPASGSSEMDSDEDMSEEVGDIETNMIHDDTIEGHVKGAGPQCIVCEFIMKEIDDQLKDKKTDDDIKRIVHGICDVMPSSVRSNCDKFIDTYADQIIQLLIATMEPSEICRMMHFCPDNEMINMQEDILECTICELAVDSMKKILSNPKTDHDVNHVLEKTCRALPNHLRNKCTSTLAPHVKIMVNTLKTHSVAAGMCKDEIEKYGTKIYEMIIQNEINSKEICRKIQLCSVENGLIGANKCTFGPGYWCASRENAENCGAVKHCSEKVWAETTTPQTLLGTDKCTYGPAHWCASRENAEKCGKGAVKHCTEKVWAETTTPQTLLGTDKCTYGPAHWCASRENAEKCGKGAVKHCTEKVWAETITPQTLLGTDKCTYGPAHWCASRENAEKCGKGAVKHCTEKVWAETTTPQTLLGTDKCTYGPAHWCASRENAEKCGKGAVKHCTEKVWAETATPETLLGTDKCTYGPAHWCASRENAEKCGKGAVNHCTDKVWNRKTKRSTYSKFCTQGSDFWCASQKNAISCGQIAVKHCQDKVWGKRRRRSSTTLVGSNPCTYGPSYWCSSEANADKCGAREHCETQVWMGKHPK